MNAIFSERIVRHWTNPPWWVTRLPSRSLLSRRNAVKEDGEGWSLSAMTDPASHSRIRRSPWGML
jgi:hypothetical protein